MRGRRDASPDDLDRALEAFKQALAVAHDDAERALGHANRSRALRLRHEFRGAGADLDAAIEEIGWALALSPADSTAWAGRSTALSLALLARFEERGLRDDLENAVAAARAAADRQDSAPLSHARCVSNLAIVLQARYEWLGEPADLNESVDRAAAAAATPGLPDADRAEFLSGLCVSLRIRYRRERHTNRAQDLRDAVTAGRESARLGAASPGRQPGRLSNLATALRLVAADTGDQVAANEAVSALRMALAALSVDDPRRAAYLANLSLCLYGRGDLDEAIDLAREAASLAAPSDARRTWYLVNLGVLLVSRSREVPGDQVDVTGAAQAWQAAAADPVAPALTRLRVANRLGRIAGRPCRRWRRRAVAVSGRRLPRVRSSSLSRRMAGSRSEHARGHADQIGRHSRPCGNGHVERRARAGLARAGRGVPFAALAAAGDPQARVPPA